MEVIGLAKDEQSAEQQALTQKERQGKTIHLKEAPDPRGRNGRQIDSDVEDI